MAEISYINPLSNEGREIIKDYGDLNQLDKEDEYLIEEVIHTTNQKISDDSLIPKSYKDLAFKTIKSIIKMNSNTFQMMLFLNRTLSYFMYSARLLQYSSIRDQEKQDYSLNPREY